MELSSLHAVHLREWVTRVLCGALCILVLSCAGCDSDSPPGGVSTGDGGPDASDDGGVDRGPPNPRPDGGPLLPDADDELELPYGGGEIVYRIEAKADLG